MDTREKLIELLREVQYQGNAVHGYHDKYIQNGELADYLIANGVTVQKWIPVSERLPEKEMEVIVYTGNILKPSVFCYHFWTADLLSWQSVTHWMPLPEPPKGE